MKFEFILSLMIITAVTSTSRAGENGYSSLDFQLSQISDADIQMDKAARILKDTIQTADADMTLALDMVLQDDFFRKYAALDTGQFKLDGKIDDWASVPDRQEDQKGDVTRANADLIAFSAWWAPGGDLYTLHQTGSAPLQKQNEEAFCIWVYFPDQPGIGFEFVFGWNGNYNFYNILKDGKIASAHPLDIRNFPGKNTEAIIPLAQVMQENKIAPQNRIQVQGGMYHPAISGQHDISERLILYSRQSNYALELLLYLFSQGINPRGDNIALALALANNYIYSIADDPARREIKKDLVKHFQFYKKVLQWQKDLNIAYDLATIPIIPKILWADRARYYETDQGVLTLKYYLEFIDRIDSLDKTLALINKYPLYGFSSLAGLAQGLESITIPHCVYRSSLENLEEFKTEGLDKIREEAKTEMYTTYFGKKRRWDGFMWLNYQWSQFEKRGFFRGDCGTYTTMQMSFYRAAGIPSVSLQYDTPGVASYTHNFPAYFNPYLKVWQSYQKPSFRDGPINFYFSKPKWHHRIVDLTFKKVGNLYYSGYYQGEATRVKKIVQLLTRGWTLDNFTTLFLTHRTQEAGLIFNTQSAPDVIADQDGDGLSDEWEKVLKTDPKSADSDQDGFTDLWESEHASDPLSTLSPTGWAIPVIDGLVTHEMSLPGMVTAYSPQGDSKAKSELKDIRSLTAGIFGDQLYLGTSFYNDISQTELGVNSFSILVKTKTDVSQYWVQWSGIYPQVYRLQGLNNWKDLKKLGQEGLQIAKSHDQEYLIPLSYFPGALSFTITYYASGFFDGKSQIVADISKPVNLDIEGNDWLVLIRNACQQTQSYTDDKGDPKETVNAYDIKSVSYYLTSSNIWVYADFYNNTTQNPFGVHTLHFRSPSRKFNWWIQFSNNGMVFLNTWKDGESNALKDLDLRMTDCILGDSSAGFKINRQIFQDADDLELIYYTSSTKADGSVDYTADGSSKIIIKKD